MKSVTVSELARLKTGNPEIELLDVRTPAEFSEVHVAWAKNLPLDKLNPREFLAGRNGKSDQPVYVICRTGKRSGMAAERLIAAGLENVINVDGGTNAAVTAGLPVVRGKKVMSLERQVRIAAGILVVLGAVLGAMVHVGWIGLSAVVGAGLVFSGITDTCGMGMMMAKLPWNQRGASCESRGTKS